jgi:hypothetical protein
VLLVRPYSGAPTTVIFRDVGVGPGIIFCVISGINRELQQIIRGEVRGVKLENSQNNPAP